jgi:RNA polymerase sigma-70 factor (ECF subfamily)
VTIDVGPQGGAVLRMGWLPLSWPGRLASGTDRLAAPGRPASERSGRGAGLTDDATRDAGPGPDDLDGFDRAFADLEADVVRVCRRLLGDSDPAADAAQEIFVRARRALHTYDRARPFRPWLLAIAGNYCIDRLRRDSTEQRIFAELDPEAAAPDADRGLSPLGHLVAREERQAVGRAISELPLKYRLPLVLRYFSEIDYSAIAEVLGVSRNQVGSLLFRAKRLLRESVDESTRRGGRS